MTTLIEAMLETARAMGITLEGTATEAGTTTTLKDSTIREPADYFKDGTIWFTSGSSVGLCRVVDMFDGGEFTFDAVPTPELPAVAIASGDSYAVSPNDYPKSKIRAAVLNALRFKEYLNKNDALIVLADTEEYTLPAGVSNIVDVMIALNTAEPYNFVSNMNWREHEGKLIFDPGKYPVSVGNKIRLWYMGYHGAIADTGTIKEGIDLEWLKWKAAENLYRSKLITIKQDDPTTVELFNESKQLYMMAAGNAKRRELSQKSPTPHLSLY